MKEENKSFTKGKHMCRRCNLYFDEKDMEYTPTEFFDDGKPILRSRIWFCKNCLGGMKIADREIRSWIK